MRNAGPDKKEEGKRLPAPAPVPFEVRLVVRVFVVAALALRRQEPTHVLRDVGRQAGQQGVAHGHEDGHEGGVDGRTVGAQGRGPADGGLLLWAAQRSRDVDLLQHCCQLQA